MGESYSGIYALADSFVTLKNTNKLSGAIAGEQQLYCLSTQFFLVSFLSFLPTQPLLPMENLSFKSVLTILFNFVSAIFTPATTDQHSIQDLSAPKGEFSELSSSSSSSYELDPSFTAMVRNRPFFGAINEDPYDHL